MGIIRVGFQEPVAVVRHSKNRSDSATFCCFPCFRMASFPLHRLVEYVSALHGDSPVPVAEPADVEASARVTAFGEDASAAAALAADDALGLPVCNACQLSFDDFMAQRVHFKSDVHVENVRRARASLPPVSLLDASGDGLVCAVTLLRIRFCINSKHGRCLVNHRVCSCAL